MNRLDKYLSAACAILVASVVLVFSVAPVLAQSNVTTMHSFGDGSTPNDGLATYSPLYQTSDGTFYGTITYGGAGHGGALFKMNAAGVTTILHEFGDGSVANDGIYPESPPIQASDGNFYGTTTAGGSASSGTVYKMTTKGVVTILHSFNDGSVANDGMMPYDPLVQASDGNLYGVTYHGGANSSGVLFKITTAGKYTILHAFGNAGTANDGRQPNGYLVQAPDGYLYGTTSYGGSAGDGAVFRATLGGAVATLHSFSDGSVTNDGKVPYAGLIQGADGSFYGTTDGGGANAYGSVFRITTGGAVAILHSFGSTTPNDGKYAYGRITQGADGSLYGTTTSGGAANFGTAFRCSTDGTAFVTLHSFQSASESDDGSGPYAGLIQAANGSFYGTTYYGGSQGYGTIYRLTIGTTTLHSFQDDSVANDGEAAYSPPIQAADGNFYGVTAGGGSAGHGTVYKTTPAGVTTILHSFADGSIAHDGQFPFGGLMQASDGNLYGATLDGGKVDQGTIFKITTAGVLTLLHSFGDGSVTDDGIEPSGYLVQGVDGNLYGVTEQGGGDGDGTLFRITITGKVAILHSFGSASGDPANPEAGLILGSDGYFYGISSSGGAGYGTLYRASSAGAITVLHPFADGAADGGVPYGRLVQGSDGGLYGTTEQGGSADDGTIFCYSIVLGAIYKLLHSFNDGSTSYDGIYPLGALSVGPDGNLYGTTYYGGTASGGTIFEVSHSGATIVLHSFGDESNSNDGTYPYGGMTFARDGNLYGATYSGGATGFGALFKYVPSPPVASIQLSLNTLTSGKTTTGTFSFNGVAQLGGALVTLSSSDPAAIIPPVVEVTQGAIAWSFPVTAGSVSATKSVTISATAGNSTKTVVLTINPTPDVAKLTLNPTSVIGGAANSTGTVTLNLAAPSGGLKVTLTSSNTGAATVPSSVTVAAGATSATFTVTSKAVSATETSTITAAGGGTSAAAALTVNPAVAVTIAKISLSPATVTGGHSSTATVTISGPAPAGGLMVNFKSTNTAVVPTPPTITIAAGATTQTVTVTTKTVTANTAVTVEAYNTDAGHQTTNLTVDK